MSNGGGAESTSDAVADSEAVLGPITLVVPAAIEMTGTIRLVSAASGAEAGFTLDEIDDLRLAASETFAAAVDGLTPDDRITVVFENSAHAVSVTFSNDSLSPIELDELGEQIVRSGVDEFVVGDRSVRLGKHASGDGD
ncbi:MAG: hypothetical protein AAGG08_04645 [Actinomycetota bacterium]